MPPTVAISIANMLWEIVKDPVTDFGKDLLKKHLDIAPDEVKKALDEAVNADGSHDKKSLDELIG
jgi:hypothetical protein